MLLLGSPFQSLPLLSHLTMTSCWFYVEPYYNAPIWSVSVELLAYAVFFVWLRYGWKVSLFSAIVLNAALPIAGTCLKYFFVGVACHWLYSVERCSFLDSLGPLNNPAAYLGALSYGIYLWHYPVEVALGSVPLVLYLGVVLSLAALSYHLFELPAKRFVLDHNTHPIAVFKPTSQS